MSKYLDSIKEVLADEGFRANSMGYVNDKDDRGGETIAGIARNFWKNWQGWKIVDAAKTQPNFPNNLIGNKVLYDQIITFYKINFWDKVGGDKIADSSISHLLVDSAINEGIVPAVKRAQEIVNLPQTGIFSDELATKLNNLA